MTEISFNQKLADKVWANPKFQTAMKTVEIAWLRRATHLSSENSSAELEPAKLMESAAILACSENLEYRHAAFNIATYTYELFGSENLPLDQALRVILSRLKNFPSFRTRPEVEKAESALPLSLAIEEASSKSANKISVGGKELYLTPFQLKLWDELTAGKNVALTAPTSAGKSFILQNYLLHVFTKREVCSVVYLVPTRALISQVAKDMEEQFQIFSGERPRIITMALTEEEDTPERVIYVLTQERAQLALSSNPTFKADIIIVDEAHTIADGSRGVLLFGAVCDLLKRNQQAQILFAGPGIRNLDIFRKIFSLQEMKELPSREATVGQNFLITKKIWGRNISVLTGDAAPIKVGEIDYPKNPQTLKEKLIQSVLQFGEGQANIIYADGADNAENYALELTKELPLPIDHERLKRLEELSSFVGEAIHKDYRLAYTLKKGVGFHYGGMPSYIKDMVEESFKKGDIKYLCSTSTLLQGVNLPAKNVFIINPKRGSNIPLQSVDFWNLAGRAGRLGKEFQGNVYLVEYENWKKHPLKETKEVAIASVITDTIQKYEPQLETEIKGKLRPKWNDKLQETCETIFTNLLTAYKEEVLEQTFQQLSIDIETQKRLVISLKEASEKVFLPQTIIKQNPTISPLRQQNLFDYIEREIEAKRTDRLLPLFPKKEEASDNYKEIISLCRQYILNVDDERYKYIVMLTLKWARGMPISRIVEESISYNDTHEEKKKSKATIIRNTLKEIDSAVRYEAVRLFTCYSSLLTYAFELRGLDKLAKRISPVTTYLELGACDQTTLNLMSLGISRHTALKLTEIFSRDLSLEETIQHLKKFEPEGRALPKFCIEEIKRIQESL